MTLPRVMFLLWVVVAAVLIARSGLYPAAMTGDEIWFADSAYRLLQGGGLARAIHPDGVGSAVADFLPPIAALAQAASFALFGLSAFAVGLPGALTVLAASALIFAAARAYGAGTTAAAAAALTAFAAQTLLRAGLYIRYEGFVVVFTLAYAALAARRGDGGDGWAFARGLTFALAGLSYYPTAPFVGVAMLALELGRLQREGVPPRRDLVLWLAGFAVPALGFALWVAPYWAIFQAQIIDNGGGNYLPFDLLRRPFDPALWGAARETIPEILGLLCFFAVAFFARRDSSAPRGLALAALLAAGPALIFPFQPRLLALSLCLALICLAVWASGDSRRAPAPRRLARWTLVAGALAGPSVIALIAATAWLQRDGRDERALAAGLAAALTEPGVAAIDQRAWLALRREQPERPLMHAMPSWAQPQVTVFRPLALANPEGGDALAYVALQTDDRAQAIAATPALARLAAAGRLEETARIAPPFAPLPWAKAAPYDLTVYRVRPAAP